MGILFKAAYFGGLIVEVIMRIPYDRHQREAKKIKQWAPVSEPVVNAGLSIGMGLLPLIYSLTPWLGFADYPFAEPARRWMGFVGLAILAAAVWLFWRSHSDLGKNWSPSLEISSEHQLVTCGIYSSVRHPMYTSQLLWGMAQALLMHNWLAGMGGLMAFGLLYFLRIPKEEQMMLQHFGDEYRAYCEQTNRIVPTL